jgi:hypothetical protein
MIMAPGSNPDYFFAGNKRLNPMLEVRIPIITAKEASVPKPHCSK